MAGFTNARWQIIKSKLSQNPGRFGCPVRRDGSVVIGAFNALKLGKATNTAKRWDFLARFASRYDLLAVQEVMDDLAGIRRLHDELGSRFKLLLTDTTGAIPGNRGLRERLAFFYRPDRIELKELASDISYDRSSVIEMMKSDINKWQKFFEDFDNTNADRVANGKRKLGLNDVVHPGFLTFIRTPHCASFSIRARGHADPIEFLGINAHLFFGADESERTREFFALLSWLVSRAKQAKRMYFKNMIVMGDLNMDFDDPQVRLSDITKTLLDLESNLLTGQTSARVNFPFLEPHPGNTQLFNTNARKSQTFDHVAFFIDRNEKGLPMTDDNQNAGTGALNDYDYGVFDFVELFAQSIHGKSFGELTASQRNELLSNTKADVSDHMPIWVRIPIPGA
jgi:hypothetical protein